jgi:hypothetical protein
MGAAERTRLRADVAIAARVLAPSWPLETFIAVNPLGGLEELPFEEAIASAAEAFGARGTLDETLFRAAYAEGRIDDEDLLAAVERRCPGAAGDVALADLLHGDPAPAPRRRTRTLAERHASDLAATIDAQAAKWVAAFLDESQAAWRMPRRDRGFYAAWSALARRDPALPRAVRTSLADLPERADDAVLAALAGLGVQPPERREYLQAHLTALPGWASHVRWRAERGEGIDLVAYLALRLSLERALLAGADRPALPDLPPPALPTTAERSARVAAVPEGVDAADAAPTLERLPVTARGLVWLDAYERHHRDWLLAELDGVPAPGDAHVRPTAQVVCCIDARSEGLRRHLEARGAYETLGFAGFFAVAIRFRDLAGGAPSALCPVLLEPRHAVHERPAPGAGERAERELAGRRTLAGGEDAFHAAKNDAVAPFALAEASGWVAGPLAAAKTLVAGPYGALRERLVRRAAPEAPTVLGVEESFAPSERALFAEAALTTMGLTGGFGRLVVLCGHGSRTENNPYEAALACGACGGHAGGPNARTAAAILNDAETRALLAERGIAIPGDTWFVAAEHDTASDRVELLDRHLVPATHLPDLDAVARDLAEAGAALSAERMRALPGAPRAADPARAARHVRARGSDWAQVFPEWGLAGNAAFVVGPRSMTRGLDLGRRCFLHSYDAGVDADGSALELILTAPLVVAQWINCQYYFSTVDPVVFGAGTKTIHNVVGGIGVLAGQGGDLQLGLPWQSVADGERLVHEPMRLLAIVQAPLDRIDEIVARNTVLQHLFGNGWVALAARERHGDPWRRHTEDGWQAWTREEVGAR